MGVAMLQRKVSGHDDPEVALMLRVRRGDETAFRELLARYWSRVWQQLYFVVSNREEAEDLTQEVFLRIYRNRKTYRPSAKFVTWIFHIARNVGRNAIRDRRRRRPCVPLQCDQPESGFVNLEEMFAARGGEAPWQPLERREVRQIVRTAITRLGGRQREALEMHQFQNRSYAEIAARMSLTPEAAKSLLYRARNQLRDVLAPFMGVE